MVQLGITKPTLRRTVTVVFICNEENGVVEGIGVDRLMETGKIDHAKAVRQRPHLGSRPKAAPRPGPSASWLCALG
eukprot:3236495-Prymnesium_polylepis.1